MPFKKYIHIIYLGLIYPINIIGGKYEFYIAKNI